MFLLSIIILNSLMFVSAAKTYDCRNGTVYLNINEIAFFETTNFPTYLTFKERIKCELQFVLGNGTDKGIKMIYVYYQFPITSRDFPSSFLVFDASLHLIRNDFGGNPFVDIAEQGFITFTDDYESCLMEFLSKEKPFKIYENQILHIRSNYFQARKKACQWKFAAPDGYGFKVVVQNFNISRITSLRIENTTDVITNERSVKTKHAYYNSDNFIQITLTKPDPNFVIDMEFQAYISTIKNIQGKTIISCNAVANNSVITWSYSNDRQGYKNNVQCFYELLIPLNGVVVVNTDIYDLEGGIEYIKYYETQSNISRIYDYKNEPKFVINSSKDNSQNKRIMFEFISDGSVQNAGFSITFTFIECKCSKKIAKCDGSPFGIMNGPDETVESYYCGNMNCSINIEKCWTNLTYIYFASDTSVADNDIFKIISNNRTIFEIIDWQHDNRIVYLNTFAENIFQAITQSSSKFNTLDLYVNKLDVPQESTIIFSEENMTAIIDTSVDPFTTVKTELKNQYFIIHSIYPAFIDLYTDTSLTTSIKYCFIGNHPNTCVVKKNKFVVYKNPVADATFVTIRLSESTSNCVFRETTYFANLPISNLSTKNGSCLITVLVDDFYFTTNVWTTSKNKNVKIFVGPDQTKLYFEFNSKTGNKWNQISFNSAIYTIVIPPAEAFFVSLEKKKIPPNQKITNVQYKSLIASPGYGCTNRGIDKNYQYNVNYFINDIPTIFTVIDYTFPVSHLVYIIVLNEVINLNKTGDYAIFHNQNVTLSFVGFSTTQQTGVRFNFFTIKVGSHFQKISKTSKGS